MITKQKPVKKNKLVAMTINESLGDIPTHFMKSGSCTRPKDDLDGLARLKEKLVLDTSEGVDWEYDLWFNTNELHSIRKWLYTDFLGKGIYCRVNSIKINTKLFKAIANSDIKIDEERIEKIVNGLQNKYNLQWNTEFYDKVIFLPGSNLLCKGTVIDYRRVKKLVDEGYVIKPHPITAHVYIADLKRRFGAENAATLPLPLGCATVPSRDVTTPPAGCKSEFHSISRYSEKSLKQLPPQLLENLSLWKSESPKNFQA